MEWERSSLANIWLRRSAPLCARLRRVTNIVSIESIDAGIQELMIRHRAVSGKQKQMAVRRDPNRPWMVGHRRDDRHVHFRRRL
jgi:hypothetical protein